VATIVGLGLVVGLSSVSCALNAELVELAQAIGAIDPTFGYACQSSCNSFKPGSAAQNASIWTGHMIYITYGTTNAQVWAAGTQTIQAVVCP
jgi:hypothetical protein